MASDVPTCEMSLPRQTVSPLTKVTGSMLASLYDQGTYDAGSSDIEKNVLLTLADDELQHVMCHLKPRHILAFFMMKTSNLYRNPADRKWRRKDADADAIAAAAVDGHFGETTAKRLRLTSYLHRDKRRDLARELVKFWLDGMSDPCMQQRFYQNLVNISCDQALPYHNSSHQRDVPIIYNLMHNDNTAMQSPDKKFEVENKLVAFQLRQLLQEGLPYVLSDKTKLQVLPMFFRWCQLGETVCFLDPTLERGGLTNYQTFLDHMCMVRGNDQDRLLNFSLNFLDKSEQLQFSREVTSDFDRLVVRFWLPNYNNRSSSCYFDDNFPNLLLQYYDVMMRVNHPLFSVPCCTLPAMKFFSLCLVKQDYEKQFKPGGGHLNLHQLTKNARRYLFDQVEPHIATCLKDKTLSGPAGIPLLTPPFDPCFTLPKLVPFYRVNHETVREKLKTVVGWTKLSTGPLKCCVSTDPTELQVTLDEHDSLNNLSATISMMLCSVNMRRLGRTHFALIYAVEASFCVEKYLHIYQTALVNFFHPDRKQHDEDHLNSLRLQLQTFTKLRCQVWAQLCIALTETFAPLGTLEDSLQKAMIYADPNHDRFTLTRTMLVWFRHFGSSKLEQQFMDDSVLPHLSLTSVATFELVAYHIETCFERLENLLAALYLDDYMQILDEPYIVRVQCDNREAALIESFNLICRIRRLMCNILQRNVQQTHVQLHRQFLFFYAFKCHMFASWRHRSEFLTKFNANDFCSENSTRMTSTLGEGFEPNMFFWMEKDYIANLQKLLYEPDVNILTEFTIEIELWLKYCKHSNDFFNRQHEFNAWILASWEKTQSCHSIQLGNLFFLAGLMQLTINSSCYFRRNSKFFARSYDQYCISLGSPQAGACMTSKPCNMPSSSQGISYRLELLQALAKMDHYAKDLPSPSLNWVSLRNNTYGPVDLIDLTLGIQQSMSGISSTLNSCFALHLASIHKMFLDSAMSSSSSSSSSSWSSSSSPPSSSSTSSAINVIAKSVLNIVQPSLAYYNAIHQLLNCHTQ